MIQRIQSLFLFLVVIGTVLLFFFPLSGLIIEGQVCNLYFYGLVNTVTNEIVFGTTPLMILMGLIPLVSLIAILMFKNRSLQIKIGLLNIFLMIGYYGLLAFYLFFAIESPDIKINYGYISVIPFIGIVLTILANRKIRKDENLIKSMDRIR